MTCRAGDMLFLSGFGPVEDMEVAGDDIAAQTALTMDHMTAALKDERATWADVVRSTCSPPHDGPGRLQRGLHALL